MHTVLRSASKEVVVGEDQPFCIIGERINPTGRKIFQEQLRARRPVAASRSTLPNRSPAVPWCSTSTWALPLADEVGLMVEAIKLVQSLTDLPVCIDSSVIEALEAGLSTYQGQALVNSVTAEDERLEAILPLVKRYGAAVIALPNDEFEIPEQPARRLELARKIVEVATGRYDIAIEDIILDPLAMPIGADTSLVVKTLETMSLHSRRARREHDCRRFERVFRNARPSEHRVELLGYGDALRPHQRHHGRSLIPARACRQSRRSPLGP